MKRSHQGHTLLELVIALALGIILMCTALWLCHSQRAAFERMTERAQMVEAGFSALHLISTHLRLAGFSPPSPTPSTSFGAALFGCRLGRPVNATHRAETSICQSDRTIRSDSLEVRYTADSISTWPASNGRPTDCLGQAILAAQMPASSSRAFAINRFFARKSPSTGKPELYCEGSGRYGFAQPLVEDIEHLGIRYQLAHTTEWLDATAVLPDQWSRVTAVELCVRVRGPRSAAPPFYLDCEGRRTMSPDAWRRQTFIKQVALRNPLFETSVDGGSVTGL